MSKILSFILTISIFVTSTPLLNVVQATTISSVDIDTFHAHPPIHTLATSSKTPQGLTPVQIKSAYNLPTTGGTGTIAIIDAFNSSTVENDLAVFDKQFSLPACTVKNACLEIHSMNSKASTDSGWAMETALDIEWAHAIAPKAKILLIEAGTDSGTNLLKAVDYASSRKDVVSVGMSWGGDEFKSETSLDSHFKNSSSTHPISFFASSGDDGTGASWPAVSPNVIAVGGTSLSLNSHGVFISEKAWSGSGGGVSLYENEPLYQNTYSIPKANGKRAIPDVSFSADPAHGYSVYHGKSWYVVGGTSAGAPQWAAIASLEAQAKHILTNTELYTDKSGTQNNHYFRDIVSGKNGNCVYYCQARARYDYVTGLGSPLTYIF